MQSTLSVDSLRNGYLLIGKVNRGLVNTPEQLWDHPLLVEGLPEEVMNELLGLIEWRRTGHGEVGFPNIMFIHMSSFIDQALEE